MKADRKGNTLKFAQNEEGEKRKIAHWTERKRKYTRMEEKKCKKDQQSKDETRQK